MKPDLAGRRVLVTGAGGFIGSHLVEALVAHGAKVRAFVHYNGRGDHGLLASIPAAVRDEVEVTAGDVADPFCVGRAVTGCSTVFHLAALIGIPYSYEAPASYVQTNVVGTLNVLEAARASDVHRVVHTSTSETYGTARYRPIDEDHPLQGQSPYSASKIGADKLAESYWRSFGTPVVTLRPFNTYGPRQSLRAVIPTIIAHGLAGDRVPLGSLSPIRDFTFVEDTVRAFLAVGTTDGLEGSTLNAGSGRGISIGDLAQRILQLIGSEAQLEEDQQRVRPEASEVMDLLADASRIREATGWAPQVTLDDGLRRTIDDVASRLSTLDLRRYAV